jgi:3-oxoacyl-[acyl-carrier-protein] synthase II
MKMALSSAGIHPDSIDYINAHATATPVGDIAEVNAISAVFNERPQLTISSTKSSTGHLLGAAG